MSLSENLRLQNELEQTKVNFKGALAQLEATKQMLNEHLGSALQTRTNIILLNTHIQELTQKLQIQASQMQVMGETILKLSPPKNEVSTDATDQISEQPSA